VAASRDAVRRGIRNGKPRGRRRLNLFRELENAVKDTYRRWSNKTARNYPRRKNEIKPLSSEKFVVSFLKRQAARFPMVAKTARTVHAS